MSRKNQVYEYLLESILSNKLPAGTAIAELDISNELNVSRTPIREALKELEAEGLVTRYPSRGTIVSPITPYDVEEIFSLRILLESFALQLSLPKITKEEVEGIEAMFTRLDSSSSKQEYYQADKSLHALIINHAGNRRLKQFLTILNSQIERFRRIAAVKPTRLANSKNEHLKILALLKQKDLNACEAALRNHLINVKMSTLEVAQLTAMRFDE
jgi:DNA-binding GntR family transcriptional regulator